MLLINEEQLFTLIIKKIYMVTERFILIVINLKRLKLNQKFINVGQLTKELLY